MACGSVVPLELFHSQGTCTPTSYPTPLSVAPQPVVPVPSQSFHYQLSRSRVSYHSHVLHNEFPCLVVSLLSQLGWARHRMGIAQWNNRLGSGTHAHGRMTTDSSGTTGEASDSSRTTGGTTEHLAKYLDCYSMGGIDFFIWHMKPMNFPYLQTFRSICQSGKARS